jgi:hypothetical protein
VTGLKTHLPSSNLVLEAAYVQPALKLVFIPKLVEISFREAAVNTR